MSEIPHKITYWKRMCVSKILYKNFSLSLKYKTQKEVRTIKK